VDRSKANGIINLMGGVGGLLAFFGGGYLFEAMGRQAPFIAGSVAMAVASAVTLIFVREPGEPPRLHPNRTGVLANIEGIFKAPDKSGLFVLLGVLLWFMAFNALETGLSSFAVFTLGIRPGLASIYAGTVTISFILFALPSGLIATRIGRRRTIMLGLIGLTLLLPLGYLLVRGAATFIAALALAGMFWALVNVNSLPLVYDHGDEQKIGTYTGLYYFASQCAAVLGPSLGGVLVDLLDDQYRWLWLFSALFMGLALWAMTRVGQHTASRAAGA
jgi:Na+/melibiose symporter-like transporter